MDFLYRLIQQIEWDVMLLTTRAALERSSVKTNKVYGVLIVQLPHGSIRPEFVLASVVPWYTL